jgi:tetratricopeptide (TPR) repeat protein
MAIEGLAWLSDIPGVGAASPLFIGRSLLGRGAFQDFVGDTVASVQTHAEAVRLLTLAASESDVIDATVREAIGKIDLGEIDEAAALLRAARERAMAIPDRWLAGFAMNWQGSVFMQRGDVEGAMAVWKESRAMLLESGDAMLAFHPFVNIAQTLLDVGRLEEAREMLEEADAFPRQSHDPLAFAVLDFLRAQALAASGDVADAKVVADATARALREMGEANHLAEVEEFVKTLPQYQSLAAAGGHPQQIDLNE